MKYIEIKAPAKINLGLEVISKRKDGYHNLSTLFYPISDLFDTLHIERAERFNFSCSASKIPSDESNLVVKTKILLEKNFGKILNAKIELIKRIPSQAGLGGGSSDAAATLISLNEMFQLNIKNEQMIDLALELGSDVPFFIKAKPAIGTSRGEVLEMIDLEIDKPILIINPQISISTKDAFEAISSKGTATDLKEVINNGKLDICLLRDTIKNDFEKFAFTKYTEIGSIKEICYNNGAVFSLMSGSGSTVYGIFNDITHCENVIKLLPQNYFTFISLPD